MASRARSAPAGKGMAPRASALSGRISRRYRERCIRGILDGSGIRRRERMGSGYLKGNGFGTDLFGCLEISKFPRNSKRLMQKASTPLMRADVMVGSCYLTWVSFRGRTDRGGGAPAIISVCLSGSRGGAASGFAVLAGLSRPTAVGYRSGIAPGNAFGLNPGPACSTWEGSN